MQCQGFWAPQSTNLTRKVLVLRLGEVGTEKKMGFFQGKNCANQAESWLSLQPAASEPQILPLHKTAVGGAVLWLSLKLRKCHLKIGRPGLQIQNI